MAIFLVLLFILQIISFYFLALLNTKMSKFDELEKKQQKLMAEMDDTLGLYLSEIKEENDRLIEKIASIELREVKKSVDESTIPTYTAVTEETPPNIIVKTPRLPVKLALKSYDTVSSAFQVIEETEEDSRSSILRLNDDGLTIEEIAKRLGKGKTEVELILKFR